MSILSGSKAWQYFLERKIQRKVECKNNVQRIFYKWTPSSFEKRTQRIGFKYEVSP